MDGASSALKTFRFFTGVAETAWDVVPPFTILRGGVGALKARDRSTLDSNPDLSAHAFLMIGCFVSAALVGGLIPTPGRAAYLFARTLAGNPPGLQAVGFNALGLFALIQVVLQLVLRRRPSSGETTAPDGSLVRFVVGGGLLWLCLYYWMVWSPLLWLNDSMTADVPDLSGRFAGFLLAIGGGLLGVLGFAILIFLPVAMFMANLGTVGVGLGGGTAVIVALVLGATVPPGIYSWLFSYSPPFAKSPPSCVLTREPGYLRVSAEFQNDTADPYWIFVPGTTVIVRIEGPNVAGRTERLPLFTGPVRQVGTFVVPPRSSARLERDVALNNTPITPEEAANIQDDCTLVNTIHPPRHAFLAKKVEASGLGWEKGPVPSQPPSPDS